MFCTYFQLIFTPFLTIAILFLSSSSFLHPHPFFTFSATHPHPFPLRSHALIDSLPFTHSFTVTCHENKQLIFFFLFLSLFFLYLSISFFLSLSLFLSFFLSFFLSSSIFLILESNPILDFWIRSEIV